MARKAPASRATILKNCKMVSLYRSSASRARLLQKFFSFDMVFPYGQKPRAFSKMSSLCRAFRSAAIPHKTYQKPRALRHAAFDVYIISRSAAFCFFSILHLTKVYSALTSTQPRPVASATAGRPILPTSSHERTTRSAMWLVAPRNGTDTFPMPLK